MQNNDNIHKGHRQRMRHEMIEQDNIDKMSDHRLLEVLLFYGIPRRDTNSIAHELLNKFGTLTAVFEAEVEELKSVKGMTENAATLIKTIMPLARRYQDDKFKAGSVFENIDELGRFLMRKYMGRKNEAFAITCLDTKGKLLGFDILAEGTPDTVEVSLSDVAAVVIKRNASVAIVSHNHVATSAVPSNRDIEMTIKLKETIETLGTTLLDHIVISGDDYVSMRQSGKYRAIFK